MATPTFDVPSSVICGLVHLGVALHQLEALHTGVPIEETSETEHLPKEIGALLTYARDRAAEIHVVVETAFGALCGIDNPETQPVACLLDEIL